MNSQMKMFGRVFVLMSVCLFICFFGSAQAATWTKTYGGDSSDYCGSVQQTSDGGYILAGYSASFGTGGYDFFVLRLDKEGNIVWQKSYGGPKQENGPSIQQTSDGGYILAGTTFSFAAGEYAAWILKLDANGNIQWQKSYGGNVEDWLASIQQTSDGGYIAAGGTSSFGAGNYDAWILKLHANGNIQWQKTYGGPDEDWVNAIRQTKDGGFIAAGSTKSFGAGDKDVWLLRLGPNGDIKWQKTYGGPSADQAIFMDLTSDNGYVVAGRTESFGAGKEDVWVLKLDSNGNIQWQKAYGGSEDDSANSIQQTSDGGYIVAGYTVSFGAGGVDEWVLKLDSNGDIQWQKTYGGSNHDEAYSVQQTADGGYVVAGDTNSYGVRLGDLWVLKIDGNGNLPGCPMVGTSNAIVTDTTAIGTNSNGTVKDTPVSPVDTVATVLDTDAAAIAPCQPAISVIPESVEFGSVLVGNYSPKTVGIMNASTGDITLGTLSIGGADASQFRMDVDCSGQTLAPAAFCNAQITFHPTSEGTKNAFLSIPFNVASQGTVTVSLSGEGVISSAIALTTPPDQSPFGACSLYQTLVFSWNETEQFETYEIQFSLGEDFHSIPVRFKSSTSYSRAPASTWKKVLLLTKDEKVDTPVFWRVVGIRPDKTQVLSNVFSILLEAAVPVGVPNISPTSRSTLPTLSWKHNCSIKFKVTFWSDETHKKTSLSYSLKDPTKIGELFSTTLTSKQWSSIRKLAGDVSGKTIFWYLESWDGLKRYNKTETMSFELTE